MEDAKTFLKYLLDLLAFKGDFRKHYDLIGEHLDLTYAEHKASVEDIEKFVREKNQVKIQKELKECNVMHILIHGSLDQNSALFKVPDNMTVLFTTPCFAPAPIPKKIPKN